MKKTKKQNILKKKSKAHTTHQNQKTHNEAERHQGTGKEQQRKNKLHLLNDILQFHIPATKAETQSYCTVRIKTVCTSP